MSTLPLAFVRTALAASSAPAEAALALDGVETLQAFFAAHPSVEGVLLDSKRLLIFPELVMTAWIEEGTTYLPMEHDGPVSDALDELLLDLNSHALQAGPSGQRAVWNRMLGPDQGGEAAYFVGNGNWEAAFARAVGPEVWAQAQSQALQAEIPQTAAAPRQPRRSV